MNKELIEKLKDKNYVRAFGLMTPEEQECLISVGKINCMWYSMHKWQDASDTSGFFDDFTYAIKPDYRPAPEFVDVEITQQGSWLGITRPWAEDYSRFPYDFTNLHCLPSLPGFRGFWHKGLNDSFIGGDHYEEIAEMIDEKTKVYARFRK